MITLTYGALSVTLPSPSLGEADQVEEDLSVDYAYSGRVFTYIKGGGTHKLLLTFNNLNFNQRANLKNFLYKATNGVLTYTDPASVQWSGIFINDPFEDSANHRERGSIALEFRGVKL
jgi:hypothetical protein